MHERDDYERLFFSTSAVKVPLKFVRGGHITLFMKLLGKKYLHIIIATRAYT